MDLRRTSQGPPGDFRSLATVASASWRFMFNGTMIETGTTSVPARHARQQCGVSRLGASHVHDTAAGTVLRNVGHRPAPLPRPARGHARSRTSPGRAPGQHRPGGHSRRRRRPLGKRAAMPTPTCPPTLPRADDRLAARADQRRSNGGAASATTRGSSATGRTRPTTCAADGSPSPAPSTRSSSPTRWLRRCASCGCWTPTANDWCSGSAPTTTAPPRCHRRRPGRADRVRGGRGQP